MRKWVNRAGGALALVLALLAGPGCSPREVGAPAEAKETSPATASGDAVAESAGHRQPIRIVLLISIDTLRADHLGVYGYERFVSPTLDLVAREGVVFEDASATSPWTLPSHASMLTGLFPLDHGVVSMKTALDPAVPTLARRLSEAGFGTAAAINSTWLKPETYGVTRDFERLLFVPDTAERRSPTTWVTDQAMDWLRELGEGRLFLFLHYYDVHADYASEPAYEKLFVRPYDGIADGTGWQLTRANLPDAYLELCRRSFDPEKCSFGAAENPWRVDESVEKVHFDAEDIRHLLDLYAAGVRQMDTELSRLFAWMREQGLFDETLLVVTSDHGEEFGEHGHVDHFLPVWQELLHVPLIFRGPGVPPGVRVPAPVSSVDIAPTILSLTGVAGPDDLAGVDLVPLMHGEEGAALEQRFLYGEAAGGISYDLVVRGYFPVYRSVRRGRFKLVYDSQAERQTLYDLAEDPGETRDVSDRHPEIAAALADEMRRRYESFTPEPAHPVELGEEEIERLRSLGYLQ